MTSAEPGQSVLHFRPTFLNQCENKMVRGWYKLTPQKYVSTLRSTAPSATHNWNDRTLTATSRDEYTQNDYVIWSRTQNQTDVVPARRNESFQLASTKLPRTTRVISNHRNVCNSSLTIYRIYTLYHRQDINRRTMHQVPAAHLPWVYHLKLHYRPWKSDYKNNC